MWSRARKREHVQCYQCKDRVSSMKNQETDSRVPLSWLRESTVVWKPCPPIPISYTSTLWCLVLPCMIILPKLKMPKGSLLFQSGTATEIQCEAQWAHTQVPVPPFPCLLGFQITKGLWKQVFSSIWPDWDGMPMRDLWQQAWRVVGGSGPGWQTDALIGIMICLNYLPTCLPSQNSVGRSPVPWLGRSWEHLPARFSFKGDFFLKHWPSCSQEHNTQSWVQVIFSERSLQVWEHKLPALSFL